MKGGLTVNQIITIGRQFGSGGRELGRRLAEELGFEYYDKEIVSEIASHTSLSENYVRQVIERTPHHLFPITVGQSLSYLSDYQFQMVQSVYQAQSEIIRSMADKSSCVIVGRCADYILRDRKPMRIFVYADKDSRLRRCIERSDGKENMSERELKQYIRQMDKNRADYYNYYTGHRWGDMENYDLCVNTTDTEIKKLVPPLASLLRIPPQE